MHKGTGFDAQGTGFDAQGTGFDAHKARGSMHIFIKKNAFISLFIIMLNDFCKTP
jgi:hypothetical protein